MQDTQPTNSASNQSVNWGALLQSPFFWGVVVGVAGTLFAQGKLTTTKTISGGSSRRREIPVTPTYDN